MSVMPSGTSSTHDGVLDEQHGEEDEAEPDEEAEHAAAPISRPTEMRAP